MPQPSTIYINYWNVVGGGGGGVIEKRKGRCMEFGHISCCFNSCMYIPAVPDCTTVSSQCEACPSCSTSTALASVITAIATALLATVISVLVMCKCHPKFTPGRAETGTSAGGEGQEYEEVDGGRGGVAVSDPTYMEVDGGRGRGGGNTFQLKENEAYASTIHK